MAGNQLRREGDTTVLRAIAALLIANSHLEAYYPRRWLAGDGLLGNSLFFFVSGCGLALGDAQAKRSFPSWYSRRLTRIYPAVVLYVLVFSLGLDGGFRSWGALDYLRNFVWPTPFMFIQLIVLFYVAVFVLLRAPRVALPVAAGCSLFLSFAFAVRNGVRFEGHPLPLSSAGLDVYVSYDLGLVLMGATCGRALRSIRVTPKLDLLAVGALFVAYIAIKYSMVARGVGSRWFVALFAIVAALCLAAFRASQAPAVSAWLAKRGLVAVAVAWIATVTLEIYMTHGWVAHREEIASLRFPLNLVVWAIATLILTYLLKRAADRVGKAVSPRQTASTGAAPAPGGVSE